MNRKVFSWLLLGVLMFAITNPAHADMAPPAQPPGSLPGPARTSTLVEMASESVDIAVTDVGPLYFEEGRYQAVNANVRALFTMQNQGKRSESMPARFPLSNFTRGGDGYFNNPEIQNLRIWSDQKPVTWKASQQPLSSAKDAPVIRWANFPITFPAGKQVVVDMSYQVQSTGWLPQAEFSYILETGAGWYGPIRKGEINLILPYDALRGENVNLDESTPGGKVNRGNMVTWTFTNLEPTAKDNWHASIVDPQTWKIILTLREKTVKEPDNFAWLSQLAENYSGIIYGKGLWNLNSGYINLANECRMIYQKLIKLKPEDAKINREYAGILFAIYQDSQSAASSKPTVTEIYEAVNKAYLLDPENWENKQIYETIKGVKSDLPPLDATPSPTISVRASPTTALPTPSFTPSINPIKAEEQSLLYLAIGAVLLITGFSAGALFQRKKRK